MHQRTKIAWAGLLLLALGLFTAPAVAQEADDAAAIAAGLRDFAAVLDELGRFESFAEQVPLVGIAPGEILELPTIFGQTLGQIPDLPTLADLENAIDGADFTTAGNVSIAFDNVTITPRGRLVDVMLDIIVSRPLTDQGFNLPISSGAVNAQLMGGGVPLGLTFVLEDLLFQLDSGEAMAGESFFLSYGNTPPRIALPITASGGTDFPANLGFTEITVSPSASLAIDIFAQLNDPDSDGELTLDELTTTALEDLFTVGFDCMGADDLSAMLTLTTDLVAGESTIEWTDACLADGIDAPNINFNDLANFSNISPTIVLQGLSQLAAAINASEVTGNMPIPFLREGLSSLVELAEPVIEFVNELGFAAITCGPIDEDPPRGNLLDLEPNSEIFCQAIALEDPSTLTWRIRSGEGAILDSAGEGETVGPNPTQNARIQVTSDGSLPDLELEFTDSTGTHTVSRRFISVQEMIIQLAELGGFEEVGDLLGYNEANDTLTFHLVKEFLPPEQANLTFDYADQLREATNLRGLTADASASVMATPGMINLDVIFGVILADDPDPSVPDEPENPEDPITKDRFFIQGRPGGGDELELNGLSVTADVSLTGMVGFVEISAVGDDDPSTPEQDGSGFSIGPAGPGPVFALNLVLPGIMDLDPVIPDAMRFREFLRDLGRVDPTFNLSMSGGLRVMAELGVADVQGGVSLSLDITDPTDIPAPTITADLEFENNLAVFDVAPSLMGTHTDLTVIADDPDATTADSLIDDTQSRFGTANLVNTTLRNLTDGSQCILQANDASASGIGCNLSGGVRNTWQLGDKYSVGGDPEAMLSAILDSLDTILALLDEGGILGDEEIPLIGRTPGQLIGDIKKLREQIQDFRSQQQLAEIVCNRVDPDTGVGFDPPQALINLSEGDEIVCQGFRLTDAPAAVAWSIEGGNLEANGNLLATVSELGDPAPIEAARFSLPDGGSLGEDFEVTLTLTDTDEMVHPVFLPIMPMTLQNLSELIACHVGIPAERLELSIADLPAPGQTAPDGVTDVLFGLNYAICTRDNPEGELECEDGDLKIDELTATLRLELPESFGDSELIGLDAMNPQIGLDMRANAQLDIAVPLSTDFDASSVRIRDTTGLVVKTAADVSGLEITGNVGPLMLELTGQAQLGLEVTALAPDDGDEEDTFTLSGANSFADAVSPSFGSLETERNCGSVMTTAVRVEGSHDGADSTTEVTFDPDALTLFDDFDDIANAVSLKIRNTSDGSRCTVSSVTASVMDGPLDTITCSSDLVGGKNNLWASGNNFEIEDEDQEFVLTGDVCASLMLDLEGITLGELGFRIEHLAGNVPRRNDDSLDEFEDWFLTSPRDLIDNFNIRDLDLALLLQALPAVLENIGEALAAAGSLPLLGDGLENLGRATLEFEMNIVEPLVEEILAVISTTVGETESEIQNFIFDNLPSQGQALLDDLDMSGGATAGDIVITGFCDLEGTECEDDDPISMLQDLRVRVVIGQGGEPDPNAAGDTMGTVLGGIGEQELDLDFGLGGVPIELSGDLLATFGWRLPLEFGVDRSNGPYIITTGDCPPTAASSGTALRLGAKLTIDENEDAQNGFACVDDNLEDTMSIDGLSGYSADRCIEGRVGFLGTYLRDGDDQDADTEADNDPSALSLFAFTKLKSTNEEETKVGLANLISGTSLDAGLIGEAEINLRMRTGIAGSAAQAFPSVLGTIHLGAKWETDPPEDDPNGVNTVAFKNLYLDAGGFFGNLIGPAVQNVQEVTKPLQPVIDTVRAPLPVVSDLSEAIGGGPITLLTLIELRNGTESTKLIRNLAELIDFVNSLPTDTGNVILIPLGGLLGGNAQAGLMLAKMDGAQPGSFELDLSQVGDGPPGPNDADRLINFESDDFSSGRATQSVSQSIPGDGSAFGVSGLSFPFLDNSSQIFGLLMGKDIVLVRYDAGTLKAGAGFQYNFGPFFVGPVPVTVSIGGSAELQARFAMGYDTSGIRKALEGGSGLAVVDGIFIDDLDSNGCDVPEIALIGEVYAGAGVDLGLIAAGIRGGLTMTTGLNLDDRPDPDGKLHIEEIVNKLHNPLCLFVVEGKLEAFLSGWVRVGFEWFKKTWDFDIVRVTLLEFEISCEPPPPMTAETGTNLLIVNVGSESRREARGLQPNRIDEKVAIRQLDDRLFSVTGFGITQTFGDGGEFPIDGNGPVTIRVDAGDGNDEIVAEDGITREEVDGEMVDVIVPFTARMEVCGGAGADQIRAGGGADELYGDSGGSWCAASNEDGNDRVQGGPADDDLFGGGANDVLSGEGGNDTIAGNDGNDTLLGGPGADRLEGGADDDSLNGGWAASQRADVDAEDPGADTNDVLIGGPGNDGLEGSFGNDILIGDNESDRTSVFDPDLTGSAWRAAARLAALNCGAGGGGGTDRAVGGAGNDQIWGGVNGDGHESLGGEEGNDFICGGGGTDLIDGDDTLLADGPGGTPDGSDILAGGPGHDGLFGRGGDDEIFGGADNDEISGGTGFDDLVGGAGRDLIFGDDGNDVLVGDDGTIVLPTPTSRGGEMQPPLDGSFVLSNVSRSADGASSGLLAEDCRVEGGLESESGEPRLGTDAGNGDCLFGGDGHDLLFGENGPDSLFGENGDDYAEGGAGNDMLRGGRGDDVVYGHFRATDEPWRDPATSVSTTALADVDDLFGDAGEDDLYGGPDSDMLRGGLDDDYLEGNQDAIADGDSLFGDAGQDDLIGGSSTAGTDDSVGDHLFGNADEDILVADNGQVVRTGDTNAFDGSAVRQVTLLDLATIGGGDELRGNQGNDRLWGGFGNDHLFGNQGDDVAFGNGGNDELYGNDGQDDLVGGSGRTVILTGQMTTADRTDAAAGFADGNDTIFGGSGPEEDVLAAVDFDVIAGDNALVDRPTDGGQWRLNTFNDGVEREVWLLDVATVDDPPSVDSGSWGNDTLSGEENDDLIFGQGGDDLIAGNSGDDTIMGNDGSDRITGDAGNDDLIGGTGRINDDPLTGTDGRFDTGDMIDGGDGFDVLAGDNAVIARVLDENGAWVNNTFDAGIAHERRILLDIDSPDVALVSGPDEMTGGEDNDLLFGQGLADLMNGNGGDDLLEGNADGDHIHGDGGQDDIVGGTTTAALGDGGDDITGDDDGDVVVGDNGDITRLLDNEGAWVIDPNTSSVVRAIRLFDVATVGNPIAADLFGNDVITGNGGPDLVFGQGGNDDIRGGGDVDRIEGNAGADFIFGDEGEDDIIGGGSATDGVIAVDSLGNNLLDGDDIIHGGDEGDVIAGDNSRITRPVDGQGLWSSDPNTDDVIRAVALFDVEVTGGVVIDPATSGSDEIFGENGSDRLFGQGNADIADDDGDSRFSEDPMDGVDNDHDGRESLASVGFDCLDGRDNDNDGFLDAADPDCMLAIDEDAGGDVISGGDGVDFIEGNHGADWIFGDGGEDDIIGGSSAGDGIIGGGVAPFGLLDADDVISGGDEDDVIVADNAVIERPTGGGGLWLPISGGNGFDMVVHVTTMATEPEPGMAFGHDFVLGNAGADEIYGQQGHDYIEGNFGEDVLIGDLGQVTTSIESGNRQRTIGTAVPFIEEQIFVAGTLYRLSELFSFNDGDGAEGHDVLLGGDGDDNLHGGPGDDILNGDGDGIATAVCTDPFDDPNPGSADHDQVMGGDGADAAWGGRGDDHLWGGFGDDHLDVEPREARAATQQDPAQPADPPEWFTWGAPDSFHGLDLMYGGWDQDTMQGDVGGPGQQPGDRLIDWAGGYNGYFVCPAAFGEGMITREQSPQMNNFLHELIESNGAFLPRNQNASGFSEIGFVNHNENRFNSHPPHPDHPGHFTCVCGETGFDGDDEPPFCLGPDDLCVLDTDCCSGKCNGRPGARTCK